MRRTTCVLREVALPREPLHDIEHFMICGAGWVSKLDRAVFVGNTAKPQQFPYALSLGQLRVRGPGGERQPEDLASSK